MTLEQAKQFGAILWACGEIDEDEGRQLKALIDVAVGRKKPIAAKPKYKKGDWVWYRGTARKIVDVVWHSGQTAEYSVYETRRFVGEATLFFTCEYLDTFAVLVIPPPEAPKDCVMVGVVDILTHELQPGEMWASKPAGEWENDPPLWTSDRPEYRWLCRKIDKTLTQKIVEQYAAVTAPGEYAEPKPTLAERARGIWGRASSRDEFRVADLATIVAELAEEVKSLTIEKSCQSRSSFGDKET